MEEKVPEPGAPFFRGAPFIPHLPAAAVSVPMALPERAIGAIGSDPAGQPGPLPVTSK